MLKTPQERVKLLRAGLTGKQVEALYIWMNGYEVVEVNWHDPNPEAKIDSMLTGKKLKVEACKVFVCPNFRLLGDYGKNLGFSDRAIQIARAIGHKYLKKTYTLQHYGSGRGLVPAFLYIGAYIAGEKKSQWDVAEICHTTNCTLRTWYCKVIKVLSSEDFREDEDAVSKAIYEWLKKGELDKKF